MCLLSLIQIAVYASDISKESLLINTAIVIDSEKDLDTATVIDSRKDIKLILGRGGKKTKNQKRIIRTFTTITQWKERWFLSSNAKDIGTLYLMFALYTGLIGTAFSVLIRLELSGPGV
jgi:hypothetical protein